jgi:hypothetical protein
MSARLRGPPYTAPIRFVSVQGWVATRTAERDQRGAKVPKGAKRELMTTYYGTVSEVWS